MATPRRKGAPASTDSVRQQKSGKKPKSAEVRAANRARYAQVRDAVHQDVRNVRAAIIDEWPRKSYNALAVYRGVTGRCFEPPYTDELDAQFFHLVSTGTSLDTIASLEGMPDLPVLLQWISDEKHQASTTFTRARALLPALYEDRAMQVALNPAKGIVRTKREVLDRFGQKHEVEEIRESDSTERAKLALSAYTWALGWMIPKKHGRNPDPAAGAPNEQLKALFDSLKSGPAD